MAFATPGYFSTAGIPLLKGRVFTERDDANAPPVLVVNKAFADKYFPGEDVIGKRVEPGAAHGGRTTMHEIVGVVGNANLSALSIEVAPIYYFPYKQLPWQPPPVILRTAVPPRMLETAIRKQVAALDSQVPVFEVRTMDDLLSTEITPLLFLMLLLGGFAGIALLLTMVGLYGVMTYTVARRTREIGVRVALGASRSAVLSMVLKQAVVLVLAGLLLGLAGAFAGGQLLRSMLFGVSPLNPVVLGLACCLIALTGAIAAYLPARRASKVDPMVALRYE
jgi:putative ABC transport system permease protein